MEFTTCLLVTFAVAAIAYLWFYHWSRPGRLPPGPRGVPFLGYLPFVPLRKVNRAPFFDRLSKKYGPVISFYLGQKLVVVLGDYASIKKALVDQGDAFSGRPKDIIGSISKINTKHVLGSDGEHWKEHRRFALSTLRNFGIGKSSMEPMIVDEISQFLDVLDRLKGPEPFDIQDLLSVSVCNNICILEFGHRYEYDDQKFRQLYQALSYNVRAGGAIQLHNFLPFLRSVPGYDRIFKIHERKKNGRELGNYMREQVKVHEKGYRENETNDYINAYFTERKQRQDTDNKAHHFDDESLVANLIILYAAGMETTTTTLRWGLLYLMMHPDVQARVQAEIDQVIGRQRMPSSEDRTRMPYTEATLLEIQRCATVVPLSAVHRTTTDVELDGHVIPRDAIIFPNLWAVHNDERLFPDPKSFRPERFIDAEGRLVKHDHVIPFSLGKRFCLGEPLARMELFLYFTAMLQRFTFKYPQGRVLTLDSFTSGVSSPLPYDLTIYARE